MAKIFKSSLISFFKELNESKSTLACKTMNDVSCSLVDGNDVIANVKLFNLSKEMEPKESYDLIMCRKSAKFIVETTLCVHDVKKDFIVSGSIWKDGAWESQILSIYEALFMLLNLSLIIIILLQADLCNMLTSTQIG
jgi:hypothetical protein